MQLQFLLFPALFLHGVSRLSQWCGKYTILIVVQTIDIYFCLHFV
nr:MAG TPA: hypothetical protein [Caudoviricetes sp.]